MTTSFSKFLERTIHRQITMYVEINRILTPFQFGFRSGVSSQDAILYFIETLLRHGIEIGNLVHAVLLDLSKAFDSSHEILLKKLKSLNFSHSAIQCIERFLTKRLQEVTVNGIVSDWIELKQAVPQGSVLGPLLFNLYVYDLSNQISEDAHIIQYADDCLVYCSDSESEIAPNRSQENIVKLDNYFTCNRLNLNDSKTEFITFLEK